MDATVNFIFGDKTLFSCSIDEIGGTIDLLKSSKTLRIQPFIHIDQGNYETQEIGFYNIIGVHTVVSPYFYKDNQGNDHIDFVDVRYNIDIEPDKS